MSSAAAHPARPETVTSATIKTIGKPQEPWELHDRLGRNKIIEKVIDQFSGKAGNTSEEFQNYYALCKAMNEEGFENDGELILLDEKARQSGDLQGKNKTQIVQLLEEKPILLPGAAGLYPPVEPDQGLWDRFKAWFSGGKKE